MKKIRLARGTWRRKPETQVAPNKKAVSSKYACRKKPPGGRPEQD